jgi:metal transporter CNNM
MHFWIFYFSNLLFISFYLIYGLLVGCIDICFSPQVLDCALGHNESALFRRAQLKALVSIHGKEVT